MHALYIILFEQIRSFTWSMTISGNAFIALCLVLQPNDTPHCEHTTFNDNLIHNIFVWKQSESNRINHNDGTKMRRIETICWDIIDWRGWEVRGKSFSLLVIASFAFFNLIPKSNTTFKEYLIKDSGHAFCVRISSLRHHELHKHTSWYTECITIKPKFFICGVQRLSFNE